jgi:anti-anti-sigma regulatory factor
MLKTGGKSLSIVSLQPKIKKLFLICALDKVMEIA